MKVAVVGAGYAGMALAWFLSQNNVDTTVFDVGGGASHVSTGLLHTAPGKWANPTWRGAEGMAATTELLEIASKERPCFLRNGIMRIAANDVQREKFGGDKLWIPEGITVFSGLYINELKKVCKNVCFLNQRVEDLSELNAFDVVILAAGSEVSRFVDLPLKRTIGQCLLCRWKERLPMSLLSNGHITPTEDPDLCLVGSTYEHTKEPDPEKALQLLDVCAKFYPPAKDFEVLEIRSGVRVSPKVGYRPIVEKIGPKTWVFTGFGSRGLIYHAMLAKSLIMNEILPL
ncbi:MAG: hypothetical protein COT85_01200 [Chlamydiae bacterium CG10_big_fil_rev_8_21_14_0_10_42_34]|nr:MAG: hypothetical protein COT85_01200 [Chlamydiae bacterium CG10_big_fil_rev_8_21_14_0_10_42_34]